MEPVDSGGDLAALGLQLLNICLISGVVGLVFWAFKQALQAPPRHVDYGERRYNYYERKKSAGVFDSATEATDPETQMFRALGERLAQAEKRAALYEKRALKAERELTLRRLHDRFGFLWPWVSSALGIVLMYLLLNKAH